MIVMSPGLSLIFGPVVAISMIYIIELPIVSFFLVKFYKKIQWKEILLLVITSLLFAPVGLILLKNLNAEIINKWFGITVILVSLILFFNFKINIKGKYIPQFFFRSLSGLIGGLGGPPIVSYFLVSNFTADQIRSNITGTFFIRVSISIIFTIILGMMSLKIFFEAIVLIPIYLLFSLIGDFLYKYSNDKLFKKIALVIFLFFGLIILFK
jgi:uncharacterized membrane protein YfcA